MVDVHKVARAEHRIPAAYGQASLVAQELLHGDIVIAFVLYMIGVDRVFEYSARPENLVCQAQSAIFRQFHYSGCGNQLAHGCHAHDCAGAHRFFLLLIRPAESLGIQQGIVTHHGQLQTTYLPALHENAQVLFHLRQVFAVGHFVCKHRVDSLDGCIFPVLSFAGRNGENDSNQDQENRKGGVNVFLIGVFHFFRVAV